MTQEIGYGLVPVDAFDRRYRELTGRICTVLGKFRSGRPGSMRDRCDEPPDAILASGLGASPSVGLRVRTSAFSALFSNASPALLKC